MLENVMPYVYGGIALLIVAGLGTAIWLGRSLNASEAPAPAEEETVEDEQH